MPPDNNPTIIHLAIPKGRIDAGVTGLLSAAGIQLRSGPRGYRPVSSAPGYEVKLLKPPTIVEMLTSGSRDVGFTGADWVAETGADLVELLDTGLDPVRMVVAAPESLLEDGELPARPLVVASEYGSLTRALDRTPRAGRHLRTFIRSNRGLSARGCGQSSRASGRCSTEEVRSRLRSISLDTWDDYNAVYEAFGFAPAADPLF